MRQSFKVILYIIEIWNPILFILLIISGVISIVRQELRKQEDCIIQGFLELESTTPNLA